MIRSMKQILSNILTNFGENAEIIENISTIVFEALSPDARVDADQIFDKIFIILLEKFRKNDIEIQINAENSYKLNIQEIFTLGTDIRNYFQNKSNMDKLDRRIALIEITNQLGAIVFQKNPDLQGLFSLLEIRDF